MGFGMRNFPDQIIILHYILLHPNVLWTCSCMTHFKLYGWQTIALIMSRRFSESPPSELTSCGTQALASSHSACCRHLLKYSNRSWREVSASQPNGCMATFTVTLVCSVVTTGDAPLLPYSRGGRLSFLHLKQKKSSLERGTCRNLEGTFNTF